MLDDSTSAVDTKTEALIRKAFREEIPDTTKIIIAQRVSSIEDADQIIVLDDGCLLYTSCAMCRNSEMVSGKDPDLRCLSGTSGVGTLLWSCCREREPSNAWKGDRDPK